MATNIDRRGYDDALAGFDFYIDDFAEAVYFSIWNGVKLKYACKDDDPQVQRKMFVDILDVAQRNGVAGLMEVRFHENRPNSQLTNKSEYVGSFTFTIVDYRANMSGVAPSGAAPAPVQTAASGFQQFLKDYEAFMSFQALMNPGTIGSDAGTVVEPQKTLWDRIEMILTTPVVEEVISGLAHKMGIPMSSINQSSISGMRQQNEDLDTDVEQTSDMTPNERLEAVLRRLAVGEPNLVGLLEKLADLKEKNPTKYNMAKMFL